jgi:hypothetical protein
MGKLQFFTNFPFLFQKGKKLHIQATNPDKSNEKD